jgi:hypothetical protein
MAAKRTPRIPTATRSWHEGGRDNGHYLSVAIDDFDVSADEVQSRLHAVFQAAKDKKEFEFAF